MEKIIIARTVRTIDKQGKVKVTHIDEVNAEVNNTENQIIETIYLYINDKLIFYG